MIAKKLRIALAFIYNDIVTGRMEELGISSIASVLRANGYEVLLFASHEDKVDYRQIQQYNPNIIGLTVYSLQIDSIKRVSHKLKEVLPGIIICVGGIYATINAEEILRENSAIDVLVRGEGEETFLELVDRINNGEDYTDVKGINFRYKNEIIENASRPVLADLDRLPFAERDILRDNKIHVALISTSRGCKAKCSFCASQVSWNSWRGRSVGNVVDELEFIVKQYGVRVFNFIDSTLEDAANRSNNLQRLSGIAAEIIRRDLQIYYFADIRAEINRKIDPGIMKLLKQSGLWAVCIGIESGNSYDLHLYNKIATLEDNCKAIELFNQYNIGINPGFINFNPYSTIERLKQNMDFLSLYGFPILFTTRLAAYKGTKLYQKLLNENLLLINNEKRYIYVDKTTGQFADFLFDYIHELNMKHHRVVNQLDYYCTLFPLEILLYRNILEKTGQNSAVELLKKLDNYFERYSQLQKKFNNEFANWLKQLLSILSQGWNYHAVVSCTHELMPENNFIEAEKEFLDLKKKILLQISRGGYFSILIKI